MTEDSTGVHLSIARWHRNLLVAAAGFTCLLIAIGGILCVTQFIGGCPDWPGCYGKLIPPPRADSILEYAHRIVAGLSGLLVISAAAAGIIRARRLRWIYLPPLIGIVFVVVVSFFGAMAVLRGLSPGWAAVDLGSALLVVELMVAAAVTALVRYQNPALPDRLTFRGPFARLVLVTFAVVYGVLVSGVLVAGKGSITRCLGWPLYSPLLFQVDALDWLNITRLILAGLGVLLVVAVVVQAWRTQRQRRFVFCAALYMGGCFLLEMVVGGLVLASGLNVYMLILYTTVAAAFWALLVATVILTGLDAGKLNTK